MSKYVCTSFVVAMALALLLFEGRATAKAAVSQDEAHFSDYQKETLTAIKDMTSNLLFLGAGVFALVGGYLAKDHPITFHARRTLIGCFFCFGISLVAGLAVFMSIISQLQDRKFDSDENLLKWAAGAQIIMIGAGSILFFFFLAWNIKSHEAHASAPVPQR